MIALITHVIHLYFAFKGPKYKSRRDFRREFQGCDNYHGKALVHIPNFAALFPGKIKNQRKTRLF
jgi:hypothetical protein